MWLEARGEEGKGREGEVRLKEQRGFGYARALRAEAAATTEEQELSVC